MDIILDQEREDIVLELASQLIRCGALGGSITWSGSMLFSSLLYRSTNFETPGITSMLIFRRTVSGFHF